MWTQPFNRDASVRQERIERERVICEALAENKRRQEHNLKGGEQLPYLTPEK